MNQKELAEQVGTSPTTVSDWLNGKYQPNQDQLTRMAEALDTDPKTLLKETPQISIGSGSQVYNTFHYYYIGDGGTVHIHMHKQPEKPSKEEQEPIND